MVYCPEWTGHTGQQIGQIGQQIGQQIGHDRTMIRTFTGHYRTLPDITGQTGQPDTHSSGAMESETDGSGAEAGAGKGEAERNECDSFNLGCAAGTSISKKLEEMAPLLWSGLRTSVR